MTNLKLILLTMKVHLIAAVPLQLKPYYANYKYIVKMYLGFLKLETKKNLNQDRIS